jgi:protocatechuate 3,4-dioxygenase, beta subunit
MTAMAITYFYLFLKSLKFIWYRFKMLILFFGGDFRMSLLSNLSSSRRGFLQLGVGALSTAVFSKAIAASCGPLTPAQTAGPFYPGEQEFHPDSDLTIVAGRPARALGKVVYVRGRILDSACAPLANATVEIWQACASGRYNNLKDDNTAALDPNFKYWGEAYTNQNGEYMFKTIIPGAYPADTNWVRPPHIHFKISKLGYRELVTQMYFRGDALNDVDLILNGVPANQREAVVVEFQPSPADLEPGTLIGQFDIKLENIRSHAQIR